MKNILLLSYLLLASSYLLASSQELHVDRFKGTYESGFNTLIILPATVNKVILYIDVHNGPPNYTGGVFYGVAEIKNESLFHSSNWRNYKGEKCEFNIHFSNENNSKKAVLEFTEASEQYYLNSNCGSLRYNFDNQYFFRDNTTPKYVENRFTEEKCELETLKETLIRKGAFKVTNAYDCIQLSNQD